MQNKDSKKPTNSARVAVSEKKSRFLTIFVCIFLAIIIVVGAVFGIIFAVRGARTVAKYDGVRMEEGALSYLAPYYKSRYISALKLAGIRVADDESFWSSEAEGGKTYGDLLREGFRDYIGALLVESALYDAAFTYGKTERETVKAYADAVVNKSDAKGDKKKFNELVSEYGFDYDGMLEAFKFIYKSQSARLALYGEDGSGIASFPEECEEYLATYSHVNLLFIRLEDVFERDESGNIKYDSDKQPIKRLLTADERAEREATVERLRTLISGESSEIMSATVFYHYLEGSDGDANMYNTGYYFHENAEKTAEFAEAFPDVVEAALEMGEDEFRMVDCPSIKGVCVVYKYKVAEGAYENASNVFFSDFYSDASIYIYPDKISEIAVEVEYRDGFNKCDVVSIERLPATFVPGI